MAKAEYIHEWDRMPRCYNLIGCPFKAGRTGTTEKRCVLASDECSGKDKTAARNYAKSVEDALDAAGIRVETDNRAEKIGYKIREARNERVPYIIVVGEKDQEANMVSLRSRKNGEEGQVALADFIARIKEEIDTKALD